MAKGYFYRVALHFRANREIIFKYQEDFHDLNIMEARKRAYSLQYNLHSGILERGKWQNSGEYSAKLFLIQIGDDGKKTRILLAENDDPCISGLQQEASALLRNYGINVHPG